LQQQTAVSDPVASGHALVEQTAEAMGGASKLATIKNVTVKGNVVLAGPMGEMKGDSLGQIIYPDKIRSEINLPMGPLLQGYNGATAWVQMGGQTQELPAAMNQEMRRSIETSAGIGLVRSVLEGRADVQALEPSTVDGRPADVVLWKKEQHEIRVFLDTESHLIAKLAFKAVTPQGEGDVEVVVSDYRDVSGVQIPWRIIGFQNGQQYLELSVTGYELNGNVDPALFERPK
jgi:hypothetical protein